MQSLRSALVVVMAATFCASVIADSTPNAVTISGSDAKAREAVPAPVVLKSAVQVGGIVEQPSLKPRKAVEKQPSSSITMPINASTLKPEVTGRVLVKFRDEVGARAPRQPSMIVENRHRASMTSAVSMLQRHGAVAWQAIDRPVTELRALETKAESLSGEQAIDLAGFVYVMPSNGDLVECARSFNDLPEVEFVEIEQLPFPAFAPQAQGGAQPACASAPRSGCQNPPGAVNCNKPGITVFPLLSPSGRCSGVLTGSVCSNDCQNPCEAGVNDTNCMMGCNDAACCGSVSAFLEACRGEFHGWDALCAAYAASSCNSTTYDTLAAIGGNDQSAPGAYKYDPCFALRSGPNPVQPTFTVQSAISSAIGFPAATNFPLELVTITTYDIVGATSGLTTGVAATGVNAAFPSSAQLAYQDPSYERIPYEIVHTCFTISPGRKGCNNTPCCVYVCLLDPSCCVNKWDQDCVQIASRDLPGNPCVQPLAGNTAASNAPGPADFPIISMTNFPAAGPSPNFVPTVVSTPFGPQARNLQAWHVGAPVAMPLEQIELDPAVNMTAVARPTSQAQLTASRAFLNSGFRGGGLDLAGYEAAASDIGVPIGASRGAGIKIGIVDNAAFVDHEDFAAVLSVEPGVQVVTSTSGNVDPHHGTAVIGILLGQANGFGITGVAPNATGTFFPAFAGGGVGGRFFNALASAVTSLSTGDIICIPMDFPVFVTDPLTGQIQGVEGTVLQSAAIYQLVVLASQLGISTVVSAGNSCTGVVTVPQGADAPSSAVVVGACWPGAQRFPGIFQGLYYCRSPFSNFSQTDGTAGTNEVDVSGWGSFVASCGYGDLWRGSNASGDPFKVNQLRTYTLQFGGTSAAAAMVAGCAARMQSTAKAIFGAPLSSQQVKLAIRANIRPQCGFDLDSDLQLTSTNPCMGDTGGGEFNEIRGFINMGPSLLTTLATQPIGTLPTNVTGYEVSVLVGRLLSGSALSTRADDSTWLKIQASRGQSSASTPIPGPALFYPPTAIISDTLLTVTTDFKSPEDLFGINCVAIGQALPTNNVYTMGYIYNSTTQRWLLLPDMLVFLAEAEPAADGDRTILSGQVQDLYTVINLIDFGSGEGKIRFRIVTIGPPVSNNYQAWWDLLQIVPNPPPDACWVAQSVYGISNPRWALFREWLDRQAPASLRTAYERHGPVAASWLRSSPVARSLMRPVLDAAVAKLDRASIDRGLMRFGKTEAGDALRAKLKGIADTAAPHALR